MQNGINVAGASSAHQVNFQGSSVRHQGQASNPYQEKKDGDKKLLLALGGLATIAAGVYLVKSGKGKQAVDAVKTHFQKNGADAAEAVQDGTQKTQAALSKQSQAMFDKYKTRISDLQKAGINKQSNAEALFDEILVNSNKCKRGLAAQQSKLQSLQADLAELSKKGKHSGTYIIKPDSDLEDIIKRYGFDPKAFEGMNCPKKQEALIEKINNSITQQNTTISKLQRVIKEYDTTLGSIIKTDGVIQQGSMLEFAKIKQQAQQTFMETTRAISEGESKLQSLESMLKAKKFKATPEYPTKPDAQRALDDLKVTIEKLKKLQTVSQSGLTAGDIEGAKTLFTTGYAKTGWGSKITSDFLDKDMTVKGLTDKIAERRRILATLAPEKQAAFEKKSIKPLEDQKSLIEKYFTHTSAPMYEVTP